MTRRVAVVIPALDEEGNVGDVVRGCLANGADWVVVADNGSSDGTAAEARGAGADVVAEPRRGYGYACAAGSQRAIELGADVIVYIDADHSSRATELAAIVGPVVDGDADLVLGSRVLGDVAAGAMGPHQRFGNWLTAAIMRRLYRITVTDLGPYRAIDAGLLQELEMSEMTFGWPTEMMVKAANAGATLVEVPASWDARHSGDSKVSGTVKGTLLAAWYLLSVTVKHARRKRPDTRQ